MGGEESKFSKYRRSKEDLHTSVITCLTNETIVCIDEIKDKKLISHGLHQSSLNHMSML